MRFPPLLTQISWLTDICSSPPQANIKVGKAKAKEVVVPSDDEMPEFSECIFPLYSRKCHG